MENKDWRALKRLVGLYGTPKHTKAMTDSKPFNHGEEGTHSVCDKHNIGGKSVCCECSGGVGCGDKAMTNAPPQT